MTKLSFPNPSRSFDATKNRVRFWGYDSATEVSFLVEEAALRKLYPKMGEDEAGFMEAFDSVRKRIHDVAEKVYVRGNNGGYVYILGAKEF